MKKFRAVLAKGWVLCILAVIITASAGFSACFDFDTENDSNNNNNNSNSNTDSNYYVGDTVTSDSLSFRVTAVSDTTVLGSELVGEKTENNFIVVTVVIKNSADSEKSVTSSYVNLYKGSAKYEPHTGSMYLENGFCIMETIGSGITKTVVYAFETPTKSTEDDYVLQVKGSSFAKVQKIILKEKA